jgi:hypothetical protein
VIGAFSRTESVVNRKVEKYLLPGAVASTVSSRHPHETNMKKYPFALCILLVSASLCAQDAPTPNSAPAPSSGNFYARWSAQTNRIQSKQPAWPVPLVTTYTELFQVIRFDAIRQIAPARTDTWNIDNSKGVNVIVPGNLEFDVNLPPYIKHNTTAVDGWGDFSFLGKYRIASANREHGAYTLSFWTLVTVPTGQAKNGSTNASVAPSLGGGKGWGHFDFQTAVGATLPTGNPATNTAGRPIAWNTVGQYQIHKIFWPELESNATFYKGGPNDGKTQEFITPGIVIGNCKLHPNLKGSRPGLTFGGGMQIATSKLHTYNHSLVLTARWIF